MGDNNITIYIRKSQRQLLDMVIFQFVYQSHSNTGSIPE